jgi:HAD superfamily hydrolase (TIGR01509 family)
MKGYRKPQPECFKLAIEVLEVPHPSHLVLIDDRTPNVEAAAAAGLVAVHFRGADALRAELQRLRVLE